MTEETKKREDKIEELRLPLRDFLYNNGLVNIFIALERGEVFKEKVEKLNNEEAINQLEFNKKIKICLLNDGLKIVGTFKDIFELYLSLRTFFYSFLFEKSKEKKLYYNEETDDVIVESKLRIPQRFDRLEKIDSVLPCKSVSQEKLEKLLQECEKKIKTYTEIKKSVSIQHGRKNEVFVWKPPKELGKENAEKIKEIKYGKKRCVVCGSNYTKYIQKKVQENNQIKSFSIQSTNLVFDFGSNTSFKDMRTSAQLPLCFMCDLVYKYSLFYNYFYRNTHFVISTPLLSRNKEIKCWLPNICTNESISESDDGRSNFIKMKGEIFVASGIHSQLLLLLHKIYDEIIEKDTLGEMTIYYFTATSQEIKDCGVYNKTAYIARFFGEVVDGIRCYIYDEKGRRDSYNFFGKIVDYFYQKDLKNAQNILKEEFCKRILNCQYIDDLLVEIYYYKLQKQEECLPSRGYLENDEDKENGKNEINPLYEFNKRYINLLKMGRNVEDLHKFAKGLGEVIGNFCAEVDNKTILYGLREIENYEGLTELLKDFEYEVLKEKGDEAGDVLSKGTKDDINKILEKTSEEDVKIVRNFLAIYAIQKYISEKYRMSQQVKQKMEQQST